eukprot:maker-scaffold_1-snap-gene-15.43-mRNA-1 protein AED:0.00 eAED:0.00 QI:87/1/1/1/0/0/2/196/284
MERQDSTEISEEELKEILIQYYTKHKPEKLEPDTKEAFLEKLIDWAFGNGLEALNTLLYHEYGEPLSLQFQTEEDSDEVFPEPMNPTRHKREISEDQKLRKQVIKFYAYYDPKQISTIESVMAWIKRHGVKVLNKKLMKKYQANLNTLFDMEKKAKLKKNKPKNKLQDIKQKTRVRDSISTNISINSINIPPPPLTPNTSQSPIQVKLPDEEDLPPPRFESRMFKKNALDLLETETRLSEVSLNSRDYFDIPPVESPPPKVPDDPPPRYSLIANSEFGEIDSIL